MPRLLLLVFLLSVAYRAAATTQADAQSCSSPVNFQGPTQPASETIYFVSNRDGQGQAFGSELGQPRYGAVTVEFKEDQPHSFFDGMEGVLEWKTSAPRLMAESLWSSQISAQVNAGRPVGGMRPSDSVVVYIHGFANEFHDALCRAAEMKHRTRFEGQLVLYSWPASSGITASNFLFAGEKYDHDLDNALASVAELVDFLNLLRRQIPARRIVLVAHSMGAELLLRALGGVHLDAGDRYRAVVLLAPDVSQNDLLSALPALSRQAGRLAIYVNKNDLALMLSTARHLDRRAGATEVIDPSGKMETIDITLATSERGSTLHHADHLDGTALYDLFWNIVRDMPAKCRTERGLAYRDGPVWRLNVQDVPYDAKSLDSDCDLKLR
jgi:esterase/lipase superfamily enzyme